MQSCLTLLLLAWAAVAILTALFVARHAVGLAVESRSSGRGRCPEVVRGDISTRTLTR